MIIDVHVHYGHRERVEPDFPADLLQTFKRLGIEKAAVFGLGMKMCNVKEQGATQSAVLPRWGNLNEEVRSFSGRQPDIVLPVGWFRLGYDNVTLVDELAFNGFRGLKFNHPLESYDSEKYFEIYEKAAAHKLVLNFHTGLANGPGRKFGATMARMNVQNVEAIARTFSRTPVLVSHFGFPEYEAAGALARVLPNLYLDISPSGPPTASPDLVRHDLMERKLLGRHIPVEKMLFGSDIYLERVEEQIQKWGALFRKAGLSASDEDRIWFQNAREVYAL